MTCFDITNWSELQLRSFVQLRPWWALRDRPNFPFLLVFSFFSSELQTRNYVLNLVSGYAAAVSAFKVCPI